MKFEEAKKIILEDKKLNDNFRPIDEGNILIYYFGEKIFEIKKEEEKIVIPKGIFNITGNRAILNKCKNYIQDIFKYEKEDLIQNLNPYVMVSLNGFTVNHGRKGELTQFEQERIEKLKKELKCEKLKKAKPTYKLNIEGLKETCKIEHKIVDTLSSIGTMSKPTIYKSDYLLNYEKLDTVTLRKVIDWIEKEVILHAIHIGGQKEKIFQEKLLSNFYYTSINKAVKKYWDNINLIALEEELNINRKDDKYKGRVDNLYMDKNTNSVIFAEVKYNSGVISTTPKQPGLYKHSIDLQYFLNDNKQKEDIEGELKNRLKISKKLGKNRINNINIDKLNINSNKFIIICGYTKEKKVNVLNKIKNELDKFEHNNFLNDLDIVLITTLVDDILLDPLKNIDNGLKEICTFEIKTDDNSINELKNKIDELKK